MNKKFITSKAINTLKKSNLTYKSNNPFPHIVIDNFLNSDTLNKMLIELNTLKLNDATFKFIERYSREVLKHYLVNVK